MYALRNEEQNVLLSVVNAYVGVVRDTQLVQLRQDNVAFFDAQVSSAEERLRIGEGTRIDVSQATARRAQAIASYRAAVASLATSQASYERWVGHKPQNLSLDYAFGDLVPDSIDSAIALSSVRHPAILTALAAIRASQAGSDAARAAFGPTLDLIGSLCAVNCFGSSTTTGISASVRLTLSVPIYAGGALGASVRKANIEQIKSEVDALAARDQIREAVISAWSTLQNATAQIESAQSAVSAGDVVLEGLIQERDVGQRTTLDVLNAQAEVTSAREGLIQATSTRIIAAFSLIAATGRLSPVDLGLGVAPHQNEAALYAAKVEDTWQELTALD
jgi:outer membrane protein